MKWCWHIFPNLSWGLGRVVGWGLSVPILWEKIAKDNVFGKISTNILHQTLLHHINDIVLDAFSSGWRQCKSKSSWESVCRSDKCHFGISWYRLATCYFTAWSSHQSVWGGGIIIICPVVILTLLFTKVVCTTGSTLRGSTELVPIWYISTQFHKFLRLRPSWELFQLVNSGWHSTSRIWTCHLTLGGGVSW